MSFGRFAQAITPGTGRLEQAVNEGITEFKNKNMQNNMRGLLGKESPCEEEDEKPIESPAVVEGIEEND